MVPNPIRQLGMGCGEPGNEIRWLPRNLALDTSTVVTASRSSTRTLLPASISSRDTHGSTAQTASSCFCWNSVS